MSFSQIHTHMSSTFEFKLSLRKESQRDTGATARMARRRRTANGCQQMAPMVLKIRQSSNEVERKLLLSVSSLVAMTEVF